MACVGAGSPAWVVILIALTLRLALSLSLSLSLWLALPVADCGRVDAAPVGARGHEAGEHGV